MIKSFCNETVKGKSEIFKYFSYGCRGGGTPTLVRPWGDIAGCITRPPLPQSGPSEVAVPACIRNEIDVNDSRDLSKLPRVGDC